MKDDRKRKQKRTGEAKRAKTPGEPTLAASGCAGVPAGVDSDKEGDDALESKGNEGNGKILVAAGVK